MSLFEWIVMIAVVWLAIAAVVGVLVGRAIRSRDRQVPTQVPVSRIGRPGQAGQGRTGQGPAGRGPAGITKPSATSRGRSGDHRG